MVGPSATEILREARMESEFWHWVRAQSNSDPVLKDMLEQVKIYCALKYDYRIKGWKS